MLNKTSARSRVMSQPFCLRASDQADGQGKKLCPHRCHRQTPTRARRPENRVGCGHTSRVPCCRVSPWADAAAQSTPCRRAYVTVPQARLSYIQFASQDVRPSGPNPWTVLQHYLSRKGARATQPLSTNLVQEHIL